MKKMVVGKMLMIAFYLFMMFSSGNVFAQNGSLIKGRILTASGKPAANASIKIKGTTRGTTSNDEGNFSISVTSNDVITISSVGFVTQEFSINKRKTLNIILVPSVTALDDIVVVGYGTQKKKDLTGAVSSVSAATIEKSGIVSVDQALQGNIAGVQMTQNTGTPGGGSSIQIRGISSINSNSEPIYVIDGVIISSGTGNYANNAFSALNPADIESIDVLKDASATAIYGSQAANGVIIITTKKGKVGAPRLSIGAKYGVQSLNKYIDVMNLQDYARHQNEQFTLNNRTLNDLFADPTKLSLGTNWQKELMHPAALANYDMSVSGGNDVTLYKVAGNYLTQDGIATGSHFDRVNVSTQLEVKVKAWAKVGGNLTITRTTQKTTVTDWNIIQTSVQTSPAIAVRNLDGSFGGPEDNTVQLTNPYALSTLLDRGNTRLGMRGNFFLEIKPISALTIRSEFSTDLNQTFTHIYIPTYALGSVINSQITNDQTQSFSNYWSFRNVATLYKQIKDHTFSLMAGQEVTQRTYNYLEAQRYGGNNNLHDINAGDATSAQNNGYTSRNASSSFFGRAFYSYKSRYMLTATLRDDGSSNFADGHRWGIFPSAAVAWTLSQERFIKKIQHISNLKLRLGYGQVGNANASPFSYTAMINNVPSVWGSGSITGNIPNPNVTWETTNSYNVGLDLGLLNGRIEFVADAYLKKTSNLLMQLVLPGITGSQGQGAASAPWANVGSLENRGFELAINTKNIKKKDFSWSSNFVFTLNKNKILKLNTETAEINTTYQYGGTPYIVTRTVPGRSVGEFYGYKVVGRINSAAEVFDKNGNVKIAVPKGAVFNPNTGVWVGDFIYDDYAHNGYIDQNSRQFLGSPLPKFTYGFGNTLTYKDFDLYVFFTGSYGNKVLNFLNMYLDNPNGTDNILRKAGRDYAHLSLKDPSGSKSDINNVYVSSGDASEPRMSINDVNGNVTRLSSRYVEDGSYLRLQTINLGYSLPRKYIIKAGLSVVKVYLNIQNVYTFTKYTGYDPEVGMTKDQYTNAGQNALLNGIDPGRYPTPRNYTLGINIGL